MNRSASTTTRDQAGAKTRVGDAREARSAPAATRDQADAEPERKLTGVGDDDHDRPRQVRAVAAARNVGIQVRSMTSERPRPLGDVLENRPATRRRVGASVSA